MVWGHILNTLALALSCGKWDVRKGLWILGRDASSATGMGELLKNCHM
jgi:hypothetical protein